MGSLSRSGTTAASSCRGGAGPSSQLRVQEPRVRGGRADPERKGQDLALADSGRKLRPQAF